MDEGRLTGQPETPPHRRKRGKRRFAILRRARPNYSAEMPSWLARHKDWQVYKRYETEAAREEALQRLQSMSSRDGQAYHIHVHYEYASEETVGGQHEN